MKSKYLRLYMAICPRVPADAVMLDAPAIIAEMRGMIRAKTNRGAVDALGGLWAWDSDQLAIAFVVKARRIWKTLK